MPTTAQIRGSMRKRGTYGMVFEHEAGNSIQASGNPLLSNQNYCTVLQNSLASASALSGSIRSIFLFYPALILLSFRNRRREKNG